MLREKPRVLGALLANERAARPAVLLDNLAQPVAVRDVDACQLHHVLGRGLPLEDGSSEGGWRTFWSASAIEASSAARLSFMRRA